MFAAAIATSNFAARTDSHVARRRLSQRRGNLSRARCHKLATQVVPTTRRYGSVCSGAFFLAAAGVTHLAARSGLSPRHFARLFRTEVGATPAVWVGAARVSAARRMLESGREAPKQVAVQCGFANADVLRRAFVRHVGVTPAEYRKSYDRRSPFA
jgi:transcriptional regulator GlxA family with amidase domain